MTMTLTPINRGTVPDDGTGDTAYDAAGKINDNFDAVKTEVEANLLSANAYADSLVVGLWDDRGNFDASTNLFPASGGSGTAGAILKGDIWTISAPATSGALSDYPVNSTVRALSDTPGQVETNWAVQTPISSSWLPTGDTWTYSTAAPNVATFTVTIPGDVTSKYQRNQRVKFSQILPAPLTSYLTFDSSNANDSVGANHGTATSITYSASKFSNGAVFNGTTSKIAFADTASLKPTSEFIFGMWVTTSSSGVVTLFQSGSSITNAAGIFLRLVSGKVDFYVGNNILPSSNAGSIHQFTGVRTINDGIPHHIVVAFRNNYVQVYVDGYAEPSLCGYCRTPAYAGTNYIRLGCNNSSGTDTGFFTGTIDDFFFCNNNCWDEATIKAKYLSNTAQGNANLTLTKYGIITADPAFSGGNTTLTLFLGTDYALANTAISSPAVSIEPFPKGFPTNPLKWSVSRTFNYDSSQASPVAGTLYNIGGMFIPIPIGTWRGNANYMPGVTGNAGTSIISTLSFSTAPVSVNLDWVRANYSTLAIFYCSVEFSNILIDLDTSRNLYLLTAVNAAVTSISCGTNTGRASMRLVHTSV